ncbi:MAG: tyrosine-type recombinase/integrase [Anaerolineales bacterium]|nr:tyrosine-type recombinase/integrase [Anaerolineales bacterium]
MDEENRRYFKYLADEKGYAENTILAYKADLEQLRHVLASISSESPTIGGITFESLSSYVRWLHRQGYRNSTIARKIAAVRSYLDYLYHHEGIGSPSWLDVLQPPPSPRRRPKVLTKDEVDNLLTTASRGETPRAKRDFAVLYLLYATGMRAAEVIELELEDVDFEGGSIRHPLESRQIKPIGEAIEALRVYLQQGRPHLLKSPEVQALFLNQRGNRLSRQGLWLIVKRWASEAGLDSDISPQTMRHSITRHLLDQGQSRREIQEFLGLSSSNTIWIHRRS